MFVKIRSVILWFLLLHSLAIESSLVHGGQSESMANTEDYCMTESFQPHCMNDEAILISSALYGRMRIGRCVTAEEMDQFGAAFKNDARYLGCWVNVLSILDQKCSGKSDCEIRIADISNELKRRPCYPGLNVYLEVNYDCIRVIKEDRSCSAIVSNLPSHIIASSDSQRKCATKSQPWTVEAPVGQKIKITLIDFTASQVNEKEDKRQTSCVGLMVDKASKRNVSICIGGEQRTKYLYSSTAESLEIYYNTEEQEESNDIRTFALKLEAVGCSDLIAPEDAWLKRNDDSIVIGCYSNRLSWELHCDGERWIGVFGNCSQGIVDYPVEESELKEYGRNNEQILTIVAVGGLMLTIFLAVLCTGAVCIRRISGKTMKSETYKAIDLQFNSSTGKAANQAMISDVNDSWVTHQQTAPTYSVFVGDGEFNDNPTIN